MAITDMIVVGVGSSDTRASNWWRLRSPLKSLKTFRNVETMVVTGGKLHLDAIPDNAIVVMSNAISYSNEFTEFFKLLRDKGCVLIYDLDDDYVTKTAAKDYIFDAGLDRPPPNIKLVHECISECDGVTVSTPYLKVLLEPITQKPVIVVPNAIDTKWFPRVTQRIYTNPVVGWAGSTRPPYDLTTMAKAWGILAKRYPNLDFFVGGWKPKVIYNEVPEDRIIYQQWCDIEDYPRSILPIDIACLPLSNAPFNRAKSNIKAQEFGISHAAVVASPVAYGNIIDHGYNGYLASSVDEWVYYIELFINDSHGRYLAGSNLQKHVLQNHTMLSRRNSWMRAYVEIEKATKGETKKVYV